MKEADDLENNTQIDGSEKKQRLDELEGQIEKLGDKYEPQEEENVENINKKCAGGYFHRRTADTGYHRYCTVVCSRCYRRKKYV